MDFLRENQTKGSGSPEEAGIWVCLGAWQRQEHGLNQGGDGIWLGSVWTWKRFGIPEKEICGH